MQVVELTFVDVESEANGGCAEKEFETLVSKSLDCCCGTASNYLLTQCPNGADRKEKGYFGSFLLRYRSASAHTSSEDIRDRLQAKVKQYLRTQDKYLSLASVLFQSQAFHKTYPNKSDEAVPIIELPRTEKGKPFLPYSSAASVEEVNRFPFSVSHQFPFAGIARLVRQGGGENLQLGMDIVTFDKINERLYKSVPDFLSVFQGSFTEWEWSQIHSHGDHQEILIQFYLRWALKEAYSKALGEGLSLDFSSSEIRLHSMDGSEEQQSLTFLLCNRNGTNARGSVILNHDNLSCHSEWCFFFFPLFSESSAHHSFASGCACYCLGPLRGADAQDSLVETRVQWTTMKALANWHQHPRD